jgi:hypothetical protein
MHLECDSIHVVDQGHHTIGTEMNLSIPNRGADVYSSLLQTFIITRCRPAQSHPFVSPVTTTPLNIRTLGKGYLPLC